MFLEYETCQNRSLDLRWFNNALKTSELIASTQNKLVFCKKNEKALLFVIYILLSLRTGTNSLRNADW